MKKSILGKLKSHAAFVMAAALLATNFSGTAGEVSYANGGRVVKSGALSVPAAAKKTEVIRLENEATSSDVIPTEVELDEEGILPDGMVGEIPVATRSTASDATPYNRTVEVDGIMITVRAEAGVIKNAKHVTLDAETIEDERIENSFKEHVLTPDEKVTALKAFDIRLTGPDGSTVEPDGEVKVSFSNLPEELTGATAYYLKDAKNSFVPEKLETEKKASESSFQTTHFSYYAIISTNRLTYFNLHIDYYYKNGERIRSDAPYDGQYAENATYHVTFPVLSGYTPHMKSAAGEVKTDISGRLTQDTSYTVIYVPNDTAYTVVNRIEQKNNDGTTYFTEETETRRGVLGDYADTTPSRTDLLSNGYEATEPAKTVIEQNGTTVTILYTIRRFTLRYDSNDGTYVNTVSGILYGTKATVSDVVPVKTGAKFLYWSEDPEKTPSKNAGPYYTNPVQTGTRITSDHVTVRTDITLYAVYDATLANYTICYWLEGMDSDGRLTGKYDYMESVTHEDYVGTNVGSSAEEGGTDYKSYTYFQLKTIEKANVQADGNSVVNVYYDRIVYTMEFDLNTHALETFNGTYSSLPQADNNVKLNKGGTVYTSEPNAERYIIQAKYEQNIADKWPMASDFQKTAEGFVSSLNPTYAMNAWSAEKNAANPAFGDSLYGSKRIKMNHEIIADPEKPETHSVFYCYWKPSPYIVNLHYMLQNSDGTAYIDDPDYLMSGKPDDINTIWSAKSITGYRFVTNPDAPAKDGNKDWPAVYTETWDAAYTVRTRTHYFYYDRISYDISMYNSGTLVEKEPAPVSGDRHTYYDIPFGASIADKDIGEPERPAGVSVYAKFLGWYTTTGENGTQFDFTNAVMPNHNLVLWAKWGIRKFTVRFDTDTTEGGSVVNNQTIVEGGRAAHPADPSREGYTFAGWYTDRTYGKEFDFNTEILSDTTVYAKWERIAKSSYTVRYLKWDETQQKWTALFPEKGPITALIGEQVEETALGHEIYYPDHAYIAQRIAGDTSKNVLTFTYRDAEYVYFQIKYVDEEGKTVDTDEPVLTKLHSIVLSTSGTTPVLRAPDGYALKISALTAELSAETRVEDLKDNIFEVPVYKIYKVTYELGGGAFRRTDMGENKNLDSYTRYTDTWEVTSPYRSGYVFAGWEGTDLPAYSAAAPVNTVTVEKGATGDRVYIAHWTMVASPGGSGGGSSGGGTIRTNGTGTVITPEPVPQSPDPMAQEIGDEEIPLGGLPKTGEREYGEIIGMILMGFLFSAAVLKKRTTEK